MKIAEHIKNGIQSYNIQGEGYDTNGGYVFVDWSELDRAIDELCAEFEAKQQASKDGK